MPDGAAALFILAGWLNGQARSTIQEEGEHAPMFFLRLPDGKVRPYLFELAEERPVGEERAQEMAAAVRATGANAIAFVSEAWGASTDAIPDARNAGDAPEPQDLLLVAAVDRADNLIVFETLVHRGPGGSIELGESSRMAEGYEVAVFDKVRAVWAALPSSG